MRKLCMLMLFAGIFDASAGSWPWAEYRLPESSVPACIPATRGENDYWWIPYYQKRLKDQPRHDICFIGDSITDMWTYPAKHQYPGGLEVWNQRYASRATNFGLTGDLTSTVLWRLTAGEMLKNYYPKHIVLLIGINNLIQKHSAEDTVAGVTSIVNYLRQERPETKILVLGLFPCWSKEHPIRAKIKEVNRELAKLANGKQIFFADFGERFLEPDGSSSREILRDTLHFSPRGYKLFADVMDPYLDDFLKKK